ncbi:MAG: hypothetical protein J5569_04085 [Oscillospiraceae bacterium]|nr:hypothetical protein [Oscillospiraceae bacterium]
MMAVNALEAVCDLLLGFTFASLFGACSGSWLLIGAVLALGFLSALILQKSKGGLPARILCALLPALGLIFAKSLPEALPPAVVIAFFAVLIFSGKIGICYEDYKYWFGFPAVPAAVVFAICFGGWPLRPAATVCAAAYLFLGVLVLRYKRMGAGAGPRLRAAGFAELTGALVFAVLAGLLLYAVMKHSVKVLETLLMPVGYLISGLAFMFDWIVGMLGKMIPEDEQLIPPEEAETVLPEDVPLTETVPEEPADALAYARADKVFWTVLTVLAIIALIYILYRFWKMIRKARREGKRDAAAIEEGERGQHRFRLDLRRKKKRRGLSGNEEIRSVYREYLSYVRSCGIEVSRQTTSEEVLEASEGLAAPAEAERLRELYIRARYHDSEEIGGAEVREAKTLLALIREKTEAAKAGAACENG